MNKTLALFATLASITFAAATAEPTAGKTEVLGAFIGHYAPLHPDNAAPPPIRFYGTDLGWSYEHDGKLQFLFGDTNATEDDQRIQASTGGKYDDAFGSIELAAWPAPAKITKDNIPRIKLGRNPGTDEVSAIDPGHAMEGFKTPLGGFSNGRREFGIFYTGKPRACRADADCGAALACEAGLGAVGEQWNSDKGGTFGCLDGSPGCVNDPLLDAAGAPVQGSGLCVDRSSSVWAETEAGRFAAIALKHLVGIRSQTDPRSYTDTREWLTSKFANAAVRTVQNFDPAGGKPDFLPATGGDGKPRVFLWGRPGFIGVGATGRPLGLYFAHSPMPQGPGFKWNLQYYAGTDVNGAPRFSASEKDAVAADMDSSSDGVQPETDDVVDQMSLSWIEPLGKWVLIYGGSMVDIPSPPILPNCGVLEFFTRSDCKQVVLGNGAIRMRTADHPWGPWSKAQDILVGGDPKKVPPEHQYAPGGALRHPACTDPACVTHTKSAEVSPDEYGFLYGVNIIEQWTRPVGNGADIIWNFSTWDPYRVVLARTRINK